MIVRKLIVSDGRSERELLLVGTIVVGRDPACQLNDLDPLLSRRHAEFVSTNQGVTIRDLSSRNGILVNGEKVPEQALKPGDQVQLGHLHLRYVEEQVVKTAEDHSRAAAAVDIEAPTMPVARPGKPVAAPPAASAPTEKMSTPAVDADMTIAPAARVAPPAPAGRLVDDPDATRAPGMKAAAVVEDMDATRVPTSLSSPDETRAPVGWPHVPAAAARPAAPVEARVVANASLIVIEASPSCHAIIGARPETIVGGQLSDAIGRGLSFVATGDGPPHLSLSIARASSGKTITITFRAGSTTENPPS